MGNVKNGIIPVQRVVRNERLQDSLQHLSSFNGNLKFLKCIAHLKYGLLEPLGGIKNVLFYFEKVLRRSFHNYFELLRKMF